MADQKAMTVADVRAMLRGEPVEADPVEVTPEVEANTNSPIVPTPLADYQLQYTADALPPDLEESIKTFIIEGAQSMAKAERVVKPVAKTSKKD